MLLEHWDHPISEHTIKLLPKPTPDENPDGLKDPGDPINEEYNPQKRRASGAWSLPGADLRYSPGDVFGPTSLTYSYGEGWSELYTSPVRPSHPHAAQGGDSIPST